MMKIHSTSSRRGFTLIELAIVLAIAGVLFVGLWRLLAGGNQQIKDSTAATQQEQLITAVKAFLASPDGQQFMTYNGSSGAARNNVQFNLPLPATVAGNANCKNDAALQGELGGYVPLTQTRAETWCNLLPPGFSAASVNAYGQTFAIGIRRDAVPDPAKPEPPRTYSFMIVTVGGDTIPDSSGGRISAQIGADGGFIYTANICGNPTSGWACGAFGAWSQRTSEYNLNNTASGHVASRTFSSPEDSSAMPWLARIAMNGDSNFHFNTMVTDLFMGQTSTPTPTNINMAPKDVASGGGNINMRGGTIDLGGGVNGSNFQNGVLTTTFTASGKYSVMVPFINFSFPLGLMPQQGEIISVNTWCTRTNDPLLTVNNKLTYDAACSPAIAVKGDVIATNLSVTEAFAEVFFYKSDRNLKNSIKPLKGSLETIMKIEPVSYKMNGSERESLGIVAQDLEKVYPGLVATDGKDGMKSVAYHELIAPMIEAIQELKSENDELRKELSEQKRRQDTIEHKITREFKAK
ncbi:MAG: tail fiber domain-containing protein [Bdellovibrionales bacterium]